MLWLALHLPLLSLEAFCATLPAALRTAPVALLAEHQIHSVNSAAAQAGIRPGMKRATALALLGALTIAQASPARDAAALLAVAHVALAYTPAVTLQDPQTVLMEVQASLRLFGGLPALQKSLLQALRLLGQGDLHGAAPAHTAPHVVKLAAAPTALGAALLARWAALPPRERAAGHHKINSKDINNKTKPHQSTEFNDADDFVSGPHATHLPSLRTLLDDAPLWLLGPGREHWDALQGMGLHRLGDLRHLPRAGLSRRFGEGLLGDLDRARGEQADPRIWLELPAVFDSPLELFARAETTDQVLAGAAVLLARLVAWAQARRARVVAFTLRMRHERQRGADVPATELRVELAEPALDAAHLQLLLRERLSRIELAAPTLDLHLHCHHTVAGHAPNAELFPTRASQTEGLTRLLERLRARLGDTQVQRLLPVADHRPEHSSRSVPVQTPTPSPTHAHPQAHPQAPARPSTSSESSLPQRRPTWLLPEPLPLAERATQPLLAGRPLQLLSGPERIEAGWWDSGTPAVRDYFIAQTEDGCLVWIYRGRLPDASEAATTANWFLQGRFA
jgi:protein ImuB